MEPNEAAACGAPYLFLTMADLRGPAPNPSEPHSFCPWPGYKPMDPRYLNMKMTGKAGEHTLVTHDVHEHCQLGFVHLPQEGCTNTKQTREDTASFVVISNRPLAVEDEAMDTAEG